MLKVLRKSDRNVPIFCCDECGSWIDDADLGAAAYKRTTDEGEVQEVLIAHKGACHDLLEARLGDDAQWLELTTFIEDALHNADYPLEKQAQRRQLEDDHGRL